MIKYLLLAAAFAGVSACGFRPLYAGSSFDGVVEGQNISIAEIPGRSGYMLRRNLLQELATGLPGLTEPATLTIKLEEDLERATLIPDGGVSRSFLVASGKYVFETESGAFSGEQVVRIPYGQAPTPYSDVAAQISASESGMKELARQIVAELRIEVQSEQ
jgi:LPS-assembly lipoprotein